jgi:hypothetical protein
LSTNEAVKKWATAELEKRKSDNSK